METDTSSVLYESVASEISTLINSGTLGPGDRVPSVRRLSQQKRVSISTVLQAYAVLENRGLIEARPQSGYYVRPSQGSMEEPATSRPPRAPRLVGVHEIPSAMSMRDAPISCDHTCVTSGTPALWSCCLSIADRMIAR